MGDAQQPATKQDLADLKVCLQEDVHALETRLQEDAHALETRIDGRLESLREAIQDSETRILRALYGYTQTIDIRLAETKLVQDAVEKRVSVIEMRLLDVEKRLNLPPAA